MKTTLNAIRAHSQCADGWHKLLAHLGKTEADDEPLLIITILDSNGLDFALWCLRAVTGHDCKIRLYAVWCARQVQHLMTDPRSLAALNVAERYANGLATDAELNAALTAARAAALEAWTEQAAAGSLAGSSAANAAEAVAGATAWDAAWAALRAARAAANAAWDVARDVGAAARDAQAARLREVCAALKEPK